MTIRTIYLLLPVAVLITGCRKKPDPNFEIRITKGPAGGYGYEVLKNQNRTISQPYIPAVQKQQEFSDSAQAKRTARLVIRKIQQHIFPSVTVRELDSLDIDYIP